MHSKKIIGAFVITAIAAATMTACGGGGGSDGGATAAQPYKVTVTASPDVLPVNYGHVPAINLGVNHPYYTFIRVKVQQGDSPVTPASDFNCSVDNPDAGALFDPGDEGDEIRDKETDELIGRVLYRNRPVGATAGVATLGFLSLDKAGDVRVTCSVQDSSNGVEVSGSTVVRVGYGTGLPAQINLVTTAGVDDGLSVDVNRLVVPANDVLAMQVRVVDAALQPVPDPAEANVLVQLWPEKSTDADPDKPVLQDVRLHDTPGATAVQTSTLNGVAQMTLTAGPNKGVIALLVTADRSDNNVANGIDDPIQIVRYVSVP